MPWVCFVVDDEILRVADGGTCTGCDCCCLVCILVVGEVIVVTDGAEVCVGCCTVCVVVGEEIVVIDGVKSCTGCDCFCPIDGITGVWSNLLRCSGGCIESSDSWESSSLSLSLLGVNEATENCNSSVRFIIALQLSLYVRNILLELYLSY